MSKKKTAKDSETSTDLLCQNLSQTTAAASLSENQKQTFNKIIRNLDNLSKDEAIPDCVLFLKPTFLKVIAKKLSSRAKQNKNLWNVLLKLLSSYKSRVLGANFTFEVDKNSIWSSEESQEKDEKLLQTEMVEDLACDVPLDKFYAENKKEWKEKDLEYGVKLLIQFKAQTDFVKWDGSHFSVLKTLLQYEVYTSIRTKSIIQHDALRYGLRFSGSESPGEKNHQDGAAAITTTQNHQNHGAEARNSNIQESTALYGPTTAEKDQGKGILKLTSENNVLGERFEPLKILLQLGQILPHDTYPGVDPSVCDSDGNNLLIIATRCPLSKQSLYAVKILCNYNIDPFQTNQKQKHALDFLQSDEPRYSVITDIAVPSIDLFPVIKRIERSISSLDGSEFKERVKKRKESKARKHYSKREDEIVEIVRPTLDVGNVDENHNTDLQIKDEKSDVWEVECTLDVWKLLQNKKVLTDVMKRRIIDKTKRLAAGEWQESKRVAANTHEDMDLYETYLDKGARILWEKVITYSSKRRVYSEVIRVWDIVLDHCKLHRSIDKIKTSYRRAKHCNFKVSVWGESTPSVYDEEKTYPKTYSKEYVKTCEQFVVTPPASQNEKEYHILKCYDLPLNLEDFETLPFKPTEEEHQIIEMKTDTPEPIILLGRSGTGKTICCLYRLWWHYQHKRLIGDESSLEKYDGEQYQQEDNSSQAGTSCGRLKQLFITKNAVLCAEVKKHFVGMTTCLTGENQKPESRDKLPLRFQGADAGDFPLFLSSRNLIEILDASLPSDYFFKRNEDLSIQQEIDGWATKDGSASIFEEVDSDESDVEDFEDHHEDESNVRSHKNFDVRKEVTHDLFKTQFWPKIKKIVSDTKSRINPSLVWTEICTYLKGSVEALVTKDGYLDKETYLELGRKRAPNFKESREEVYECFLEYQKLKNQKRYFDECDLIFRLYNRLMQRTDKDCWKIHQIYVDETQDFTQAELWLLIHVCEDPNNMFLTGDTAQSIMRGIAFRFTDLKSLFYRANEISMEIHKRAMVTVPKNILQLTYNYRSHSGILDLSASVIDLMINLFPDSFDRLARDIGFIEGPIPKLVSTADMDDLVLRFGGKGDKSSTIEFGTEQVVLVADDEAKRKMPQNLFGQVLTIFEAKGLEFNDVLLYNFFRDSQAKEEWTIVDKYKYIPGDKNKQSLVKLKFDTTTPCQQVFNPNQYTILNSDLKHLYTALTRARVNILIFEEEENKKHPMLGYFLEGKVLQKGKGTDPLFSLSNDEWEKRGDRFYRKGTFKRAIICYQNCRQKEKEEKATLLQRKKDIMSWLSSKDKKLKLLVLSEKFFENGMFLPAKDSIEHAKEPYLQAKMYEKLGEVEKALEIYKRNGYAEAASKIYEDMLDFKKALDVLEQSKQYEEALNLIMRFKIKMKEASIEDDLVSNLEFSKIRKLQRMNLKKRTHQEENCNKEIDSFMSKQKRAEEQQKVTEVIAQAEDREEKIKESKKPKEPLLDIYCAKCHRTFSFLLNFQTLRGILDEAKNNKRLQDSGKSEDSTTNILLGGIQDKKPREIIKALNEFKTTKNLLGVLECLVTLEKGFLHYVDVESIQKFLDGLGKNIQSIKDHEYWEFYGMEDGGHSVWSCKSQTNEDLFTLKKKPRMQESHVKEKTDKLTQKTFLQFMKERVAAQAKDWVEKSADRYTNNAVGNYYLDAVTKLGIFLKVGLNTDYVLSRVKQTLLPPSGHRMGSFQSAENTQEVFKVLEKNNCHRLFLDWGRKMWKDASDYDKMERLDFVWGVYQDLTLGRAKNKEFCDQLSVLENICNNKTNAHSKTVGFLNAQDSAWNYSIFWVYIIALEDLHQNKNPKEALKMLAFFLGEVREMSGPNSGFSIASYMEVMELMIVLAFSLYSCNVSKDNVFFLPESYLCTVHFWDKMHALTFREDFQTLFQSVRTFQEKSSNDIHLDVIMDQMVKIVIGDAGFRTGLLHKAVETPANMQNGECERIIKMSLVMLCNGLFAAKNEKSFLKAFSDCKVNADSIPENIKKVFKEVGKELRPNTILSDMLKERKEQLKTYKWENEKLCLVEWESERTHPREGIATGYDKSQEEDDTAQFKEDVITRIKGKKKRQKSKFSQCHSNFLKKEKKDIGIHAKKAKEKEEQVLEVMQNKKPQKTWWDEWSPRIYKAAKWLLKAVTFLIVVPIYYICVFFINPFLKTASMFIQKEIANIHIRKEIIIALILLALCLLFYFI